MRFREWSTSILFAAACAIAATWGLAIEHLQHEQGQAEKRAVSVNANLAVALDEYVIRTIGAVDQVLLRDPPAPVEGARPDLAALLREVPLRSYVHSTLAIADAAGRVVLHGLDTTPNADVRDREWGGSLQRGCMTARTRCSLTNALRCAIERDELALHYQLRYDLSSARISGAEALARWDDPTMGDIPRGKFISIAESARLIGDVGMWFLRTACRQMKVWQDATIGVARITVNFSARQFHDPHLVDNVASVLRECELDAALLEFEVPESVMMSDPDEAARTTQLYLRKICRFGRFDIAPV